MTTAQTLVLLFVIFVIAYQLVVIEFLRKKVNDLQERLNESETSIDLVEMELNGKTIKVPLDLYQQYEELGWKKVNK